MHGCARCCQSMIIFVWSSAACYIHRFSQILISSPLQEALTVLQMIKKRGLQPDRFTFTTLLIACGRTGSSDQVDHIMQVMKQAGVVPDEIAFGAAIDAHRRAGNSVKALECLQDMHKCNLEPSAAHYNLVLRTLKAEVRLFIFFFVAEDLFYMRFIYLCFVCGG